MKLNIGCGARKKKGYINIDSNKRIKPNVMIDVTKGLPFDNNSTEEIMMIHFLEHLFYIQAEPFLKECHRVLKPGGILQIEVPDIVKMAKLIASKKRDLQPCLRRIYGGNAIKNFHIPGMHKWGWTGENLKEILHKTKFKITEISGGKYHHSKWDTLVEARKK